MSRRRLVILTRRGVRRGRSNPIVRRRIMNPPFFDLRATHNPHRWFLPLSEDLCVGPPGDSFMFGGVGMAAAISAMEGTCGRPVIWATAQYLSFARPPSVVDLDVRAPTRGHYTTQARVIAHVGDREILTVNAALGARPGDISHQWCGRGWPPRKTARRASAGHPTGRICTAASRSASPRAIT